MPQLTAQEKRYLRAERLAADKASAGWSYMAISMGAAIALTSWFALGVVAAGGLALRFHNRRAECDNALLDPPRDDFAIQTRPRPRRFDAAALGESPIELAIAAAGLTLTRSDAYLSAMVRADERAWGAREANAIEFQRLRVAEGKRYARAFAAHESSVSDRLLKVAALGDAEVIPDLPGQATVAAWVEQLAGVSLLEAIPPESRGRLRKLSVPEGPLLQTVGTIFESAPQALRNSPTIGVSRQTAQAAELASSLSESWPASNGDDPRHIVI